MTTAPSTRTICQLTGSRRPRTTRRLDAGTRDCMWRSTTGLIWSWSEFACCTNGAGWHFWSNGEQAWVEGGELAQAVDFKFSGPFTEITAPANSSPTTHDRPEAVSAGPTSTAPASGHLTSAVPPAAVDDPAAVPLPASPAAAGSPPPDHATSDLLIAAANQLSMWSTLGADDQNVGQLGSPVLWGYYAELIPELRDCAAQFAAHGD